MNLDRSWPAKPYKTDELIETYVTAMASTNYAEVRSKITDENKRSQAYDQINRKVVADAFGRG